MKRFLIFMICGPLIAHLVTMSLLLSPSDLMVKTLANIPNILLVGAIPALLVCILDAIRERPRAWAYCAVAGWVSSYIPVLAIMAVFSHRPEGSLLLKWGVGGLVAGAVCSWLSSEKHV